MTDEFNPTPRIGDRLEAVIGVAKDWARLTRNDLRFKVASLTLSERAKLERSIRERVRTRDVDIEKISFSFDMHGMFFDQGVGKGRKKGSAKAREKAAQQQWLSPVLDIAIEDLADILEKEYADVAAGELVLRIPGEIETKITVNG